MAQNVKEEVTTSITENNLLQVIKQDDVKAFDVMMDKTQCGAYRLGRFPVLSLLYLYKSKRILSAYEGEFLKLTNYVALGEPIELSHKFASKAKKCLRLYFNEIVSPLEMLLILDKAKHLKKVFSTSAVPSSAVKGRLKSIYYIKYSLSVRFEGDEIFIDKRPLSYAEKKRIATICICAILAIVLVIGVPVTTISLIPKPVEGEVTKLSQIDFASDKAYILKKDIIIPDNYSVSRVNCQITGAGKKLVFGKGASLGELNGKLTGLTIESNGNALFTTINGNATIENTTINVNADVSSSQATAFVALVNYGTIDNVTLNVNGKVKAIATSAEATSELTFGAMVQSNSSKYDTSTQSVFTGTIKNSKVNYSQFSLVGEASANAAFGGVAGINGGYLQDCSVGGEIVADTFDIAGICSVNSGMLSKNTNEANISQTSADIGWNPIASGIVLTNAYVVEDCKNTGKISAVSNSELSGEEDNIPTVSVSGIAYVNSNAIVNCTNSGEIYAKGKGEAYVGGIASRAYSQITGCLSSGAITADADVIYAGGILGSSEVTLEGYYVYFGTADNCISESKINVSAVSAIYVGGITGYIHEKGIEQQKYEDGEIVTFMTYFGGAVTNCYFTGAISLGGENAKDGCYVGSIVGVIGANIYESNSYSTNTSEHHNLDGNYYLQNSISAIGATTNDDKTFASAEDKGASPAAIDVIQSFQSYKDILSNLTSKS